MLVMSLERFIKVFRYFCSYFNSYTFTYYEHHFNGNDLIIVISQSGLSTNAIEALKKS